MTRLAQFRELSSSEVLSMETDQDRVIVAEGAGDRHGVQLTRVHHHDFPDIHAEGETPAIAAAELAGQLTRILDAPPDPASRESAERALDDIRIFIQSNEV